MASLLAQLAAGGAVALPAAGRFSASLFWEEVAEARATWFSAVPTMHQILLARHKAGGAPRAARDEQGEGGGERGEIEREKEGGFVRLSERVDSMVWLFGEMSDG